MAPPDRQDFGFKTNKNRGENRVDGRQVIVPESGTTKRTHLAPLYHPDALVNPDTYIVTLEALALKLRYRFRQKKNFPAFKFDGASETSLQFDFC